MSSGVVGKEVVAAVAAAAEPGTTSSEKRVGKTIILQRKLMINETADNQLQISPIGKVNNVTLPKILTVSSQGRTVRSDLICYPIEVVNPSASWVVVGNSNQVDGKSSSKMRMKVTGEDTNRASPSKGQTVQVTHADKPMNIARKASNTESLPSANGRALVPQVVANTVNRSAQSNPPVPVVYCGTSGNTVLGGTNVQVGSVSTTKQRQDPPRDGSPHQNLLTDRAAHSASGTKMDTISKNLSHSANKPFPSYLKSTFLHKGTDVPLNAGQSVVGTERLVSTAVDKHYNGAANSNSLATNDVSHSLLKKGKQDPTRDFKQALPGVNLTDGTSASNFAISAPGGGEPKDCVSNHSILSVNKADISNEALKTSADVSETATKVSREVKILKAAQTTSKVLGQYINEAAREGKLRVRRSSTATSTSSNGTSQAAPSPLTVAHRKRLRTPVTPGNDGTQQKSSLGAAQTNGISEVSSLEEETQLSLNTSGKRTGMRSENADFKIKQRNFLSNIRGDTDAMEDCDVEDSITGSYLTSIDSFSAAASDMDELSTSPAKHGTDGTFRRLAEPPKVGYDRFCWRCKQNDEGMIGCYSCVRSFHKFCTRPAYFDSNWNCQDCRAVATAKELHSTATDKNLAKCIKYALDTVYQQTPGAHLFRPINKASLNSYDQVVTHHMDLVEMFNKAENEQYLTTEDFISDFSWIVHNLSLCVGNTMVQTAKMLYKAGKQQKVAIEACRECFINLNTKPSTWFKEACSMPHLLVWAKVKGYPYWPAKLITVNANNQANVSFFATYDRAWVKFKDCFLFCERDPNPKSSKSPTLNESLVETNGHIANLITRFGSFNHAAYRKPLEAGRIEQHLRDMLPGAFSEARKEPIAEVEKLTLKIMKTTGKIIALRNPSIKQSVATSVADHGSVSSDAVTLAESMQLNEIYAGNPQSGASPPSTSANLQTRRITRRMSKAQTNAADSDFIQSFYEATRPTEDEEPSTATHKALARKRKSVCFERHVSENEPSGKIQSLVIRRNSGNWATEPKRRKSFIAALSSLSSNSYDEQGSMFDEPEGNSLIEANNTAITDESRNDPPSTVPTIVETCLAPNKVSKINGKEHTVVKVSQLTENVARTGPNVSTSAALVPAIKSNTPNSSVSVVLNASSTLAANNACISGSTERSIHCLEPRIIPVTSGTKEVSKNASAIGSQQPIASKDITTAATTNTEPPLPYVAMEMTNALFPPISIKMEVCDNDPEVTKLPIHQVDAPTFVSSTTSNGPYFIELQQQPTATAESTSRNVEKLLNASNQRARKSIPGSGGLSKSVGGYATTKGSSTSCSLKAPAKPAVNTMTIIPKSSTKQSLSTTLSIEDVFASTEYVGPLMMAQKKNAIVSMQDSSIPPTTVTSGAAVPLSKHHAIVPAVSVILSTTSHAVIPPAASTVGYTAPSSSNRPTQSKTKNSLGNEPKLAPEANAALCAARSGDKYGKNTATNALPDDDVIIIDSSSELSAGNASTNSRVEKKLPQLQPKPTTTAVANSSDCDADDTSEPTDLTATLEAYSNEMADKFRALFEDAVSVLSKNGSLKAQLIDLNVQLERERKRTRESQQMIDDLKAAHARELDEVEAKYVREAHLLRQNLASDKMRTINRIKKQMWCKVCAREANFYCCWNTAYCTDRCQMTNWAEHQLSCEQKDQTSKSQTATTSIAQSPRELANGTFSVASPFSVPTGSGQRTGNIRPRSTGSSTSASSSETYLKAQSPLAAVPRLIPSGTVGGQVTYQTPRIQAVHSRATGTDYMPYKNAPLSSGKNEKNVNLQPQPQRRPQRPSGPGRILASGENLAEERRLFCGNIAIGGSKNNNLGRMISPTPVAGTLTTVTLPLAGPGGITSSNRVSSNVLNQIIVQSGSTVPTSVSGRPFITLASAGSSGGSGTHPITMMATVQNSICNTTTSLEGGGSACASVRSQPR